MESSRTQLSGFDGLTAFGGALRFIVDPATWLRRWDYAYGKLAPTLEFFASDAFSTLFGYDPNGRVRIFVPDTAEYEHLEMSEGEFCAFLSRNAEDALNLEMYRQALTILGRPGVNDVFGLKIDAALGGTLTLDNLYIVDQVSYLRTLGSLAQQLNEAPLGTRFTKIDLE